MRSLMATNETIQNLLSQLEYPDADTRLLAVKRLGMYYDPHLIEPLLKMLKDPDARIREATIIALGAIGEPEVIDPIILCLEDSVNEVKLAAIKTLGELTTIKATKPLIKLLEDNFPKIRVAAAIALGQIEDKNALFPLIDRLEDKDNAVKISAILALGQIGDLRAVDPILKTLADSPEIQRTAAITLQKFNDPRVITPLVHLLNSPDAKVRKCAIVSLGAMKNPQIIEPMLKLLNDENADVRRAAAQALSEIKDSTTVEHFINSLEDNNPSIRETAARALGRLGDAKAISALVNALKDPKPEVRKEAAQSLGELGQFSAIKPLSKLLKDDNPEVRAAVVRSISLIESRDNTANGILARPTTTSAKALMKGLEDSELLVRTATAEALAKLHASAFKFDKAEQFYTTGAKESFVWDFHQNFFQACALGCKILDNIKKGAYNANVPHFPSTYNLLKNAAKMLGSQEFISEQLWKAVEAYNLLFINKQKEIFLTNVKDFGMHLMLLQKKIPEEFQKVVDRIQDQLNAKYQLITKKGLELAQAYYEIDPIQDEIFLLASRILILEPLELKREGTQEKSINVIESLMTFSNTLEAPDIELNTSSNRSIPITIPIPSTTKNFLIEEVEIGKEQNIPDTIQFALIQLLKGVKKLSFIDENREIFMRFIERYYDVDVFKTKEIMQFTKDAINFNVKAKIIGFMDDALYEDTSLTIFPECSVPFSYLEKLKEYADQFNTFIIAGVENILENGKYYNRAYVISPYEEMVYQQKNRSSRLPAGPKFQLEWKEGIEETSPPLFRIFNSPFGRFIILIGEDIKEYSQYLSFISREYKLDFAICISNAWESENSMKKYQELVNDMKKPLFYCKTGQFGYSEVFKPIKEGEDRQPYGPYKENTEGILFENFNNPKKYGPSENPTDGTNQSSIKKTTKKISVKKSTES